MYYDTRAYFGAWLRFFKRGMTLTSKRRLLFAENENVKNLEYAKGIHDQKRHKPLSLAKARRLPQRHALPREGPRDRKKNDPYMLL